MGEVLQAGGAVGTCGTGLKVLVGRVRAAKEGEVEYLEIDGTHEPKPTAPIVIGKTAEVAHIVARQVSIVSKQAARRATASAA